MAIHPKRKKIENKDENCRLRHGLDPPRNDFIEIKLELQGAFEAFSKIDGCSKDIRLSRHHSSLFDCSTDVIGDRYDFMIL